MTYVAFTRVCRQFSLHINQQEAEFRGRIQSEAEQEGQE